MFEMFGIFGVFGLLVILPFIFIPLGCFHAFDLVKDIVEWFRFKEYMRSLGMTEKTLTNLDDVQQEEIEETKENDGIKTKITSLLKDML